MDRIFAGGLYYQATDSLLAKWKEQDFEVEDQPALGRIALDQTKGAGIELFLQPEGAGVLSVCLRMEGPELPLDRVKAFVYRPCQHTQTESWLPRPAVPRRC